jgi:hypothetical protein
VDDRHSLEAQIDADDVSRTLHRPRLRDLALERGGGSSPTGNVQVLQRRLADVRRDLVQPRAFAILQLDELRLQLAEPRALPRQGVCA